MRHLNRNYGICLVLALLIMTALFAVPQDSFAQPALKIDGKVLNTSSVKLSWSIPEEKADASETSTTAATEAALKESDIASWTISRAVVYRRGTVGKYKDVVTLKGDETTCTVDGLKENYHYRFLIKGEVKSGSSSAQKTCSGTTEHFTGLPKPEWAEDAETKYECSPEKIDVALQTKGSYGLPADGYVIYRGEKTDEDTKYKRLAVVKDSDKNSDGIIVYKDSDVAAGKTYQYKACSFQKIKDKDGKDARKYSNPCKALTRGAFNMEGSYSVTNERFGENQIVIRVYSKKNNGKLKLDTHDIFYGDDSEYEKPIVIKAWSKDGKSWTDLETLSPEKISEGEEPEAGVNFVELKQGQIAYLKFGSVESKTNLKKLGYQFKTTTATYNGVDCDFEFSLTGKGRAGLPKEEEKTDTEK